MVSCLVEYKNIPHLNQIYIGFSNLHAAKIIDLKFTTDPSILELENKAIIKVILNNKTIIYFDNLDGLNWINANEESNLDFFKKTFKCDYYFKRSYLNILDEKVDFKVLPLGLNFGVNFESPFKKGLKAKLTSILKQKKIIIKLFKINTYNIPVKALEYYPQINLDNFKILFSARLWNPALAKNEESKLQREKINSLRINIVEQLRETYGNQFIGGIIGDNYSTSILDDKLILPFNFTNRESYINTMKNSTICIGTTGLHNSIGWKFAEYVMAAKAIITEPLHYMLSEDFKEKQNYLVFETAAELIQQINYLIEDKERIRNMMYENYKYYNLSLRPDISIYNILAHTTKE